jgi:bifunctional DNase/RNase
MLQVRVAAVARDASGQHVIVLKPLDAAAGTGAVVPIWIGTQEATSILVAIEGVQTPRPLTHDLLREVLSALHAEVTRVEVTRIDEGTFYAEITLVADGAVHTIDARPSDAVALASRVGAPIWVADEVFADAGIPDTLTETDDEATLTAFTRFLDDVEPDDFRG